MSRDLCENQKRKGECTAVKNWSGFTSNIRRRTRFCARIDELLEQIRKQSGHLSEQSVQLGELLGEIRLLRKSLERSEKREAKYKQELSKLESQLSNARNDRYDDQV